jgi:hypothetical protein
MTIHTVIFNPETMLGDANPNSVHDAVMWCDQEFGRDNYNLDNQFPSWRWKFTFNESKHATHFALKWL